MYGVGSGSVLVKVTLVDAGAVEDVTTAWVNMLITFIWGSKADELIVALMVALVGRPNPRPSSRNEFSTQSSTFSCCAVVIGLAANVRISSQVRSSGAELAVIE